MIDGFGAKDESGAPGAEIGLPTKFMDLIGFLCAIFSRYQRLYRRRERCSWKISSCEATIVSAFWSSQILTEKFLTVPTSCPLMAQYNGRTVAPLEQVCCDFFGHLTVDK
jgi:hypothetical protein